MEERDENGKIILNLNNPIFALYIDIEALSRQRAEETIAKYREGFGIYSNVVIWIFPSKETKIECIYSENSNVGGKNNEKVLENLNKMVGLLSTCDTQEEFIYNLREIRLNDLDQLLTP